MRGILRSLVLGVLIGSLASCNGETAGSFSGRCSVSPNVSILTGPETEALLDGTNRAKDACVAAGQDCSRRIQHLRDGGITILVDVATWNEESGQCTVALGSLAAYEYNAQGKFLRQVLAI